MLAAPAASGRPASARWSPPPGASAAAGAALSCAAAPSAAAQRGSALISAIRRARSTSYGTNGCGGSGGVERGRGKLGTTPDQLRAARLCGALGEAETASGHGGGLLLPRLLGGRGGAGPGGRGPSPRAPYAHAFPPGCRAQASLKASMALRPLRREHVLKCE